MHLITELTVSNFRSIREATFPLCAFTPLVGINNAGKSNVLRALYWLIGGGKVPATEFRDLGSPVHISARVNGIDDTVLQAIGETHRGVVSELLADGSLYLRRVWQAPAGSGPLEVSPDGQSWRSNPRGIDPAIAALFPEPIRVEAMEDAAEQMGKTTSGTAIGRLMKEIAAAIVERNAIPANAALAEHFARLRADSSDRDPELARIDAILAHELQGLFGGVQAQIDIRPPDFTELVKSASVRLRDTRFGEDAWRAPSDMGHGAQRSVLVALIRCLAELRRGEAGGRTTLLLIDEPELYLHPQAVEGVRSALHKLAMASGWQVVFSTHSPLMIDQHNVPDALLIRRGAETGTYALPRMRDAVQNAINDSNHQAETLFALTHSTRILFSDCVLLVEGKTERQLLPNILTYITGQSPGEYGVALVDVGSKNDFIKAVLSPNSSSSLR